MRVLVTGASGFVGQWVVKGLIRRGHSVIAVGRRNVPVDADASGPIQWRSCNLLDQADVESLVASEQAAGLIHCAWDTTPGAYWTSSENLKWVAGSLHLLEAFVRCGGRRVVIAGTSAEYDWSGDETLHEDTSAVVPGTLYGTAKNSLHHILQQWTPTNDLSLAWGRIFCPYGPGENAARLVPRLIQALSSGEPLPFDSGSLIRDFLCVKDVGDAFAEVFDSGFEGTVNVASGCELSIGELVRMISRCVGNERVDFGTLPDPIDQPHRIVADTTRLNRVVGWTPSRSNEARILETCQSIQHPAQGVMPDRPHHH
ncbi:dTDP-glucose 4,6-dehydratase [Allorhodopirellula solitaria]|uniref:dTDP-glucose 4,6-dehydratase n=2 Tax=Allorhodopirellula solitaria TaxID=2527987 RepID=A0A5C5YF32_9BACT|nr:dTDP-glucose 4,6-dehydratase [Allorhodopirellula solitaria]